MAICLLGADKKYIIHISTDPQIAWHTAMCKISINIKKRQFLTPQTEVHRLPVLLKKKMKNPISIVYKGKNEY